MKSILYITTIAGFLPQFEMNDVEIIQSMGYKVFYATNFNNPIYSFNKYDLEKIGVSLHHIDVEKSPKSFISNFKAILQIKRIIDENKINLIHCHNPMGGVTARIAGALSKCKPKVIYTAHGLHFYKGAPLINWILYYPVELILAHLSDAIVTINSEDFDRVKKHFKIRSEGLFYKIPGVGVNKQRFAPKKEIGIEKRKELNIPQEAFHIASVAELNDNKNQKIIIKALKNIKYKDIYYSICGKGPSYDSIKDFIQKSELEDRVKLLGYRNDIDEILQTADIFAFPSKREGLGIAAIEALSCGVPVIAADNRGSREYMQDGVNGFVCHADNDESFEEKIELLYEDTELRHDMSAIARQSVEGFSDTETIKVMKKAYHDLDMLISN